MKTRRSTQQTYRKLKDTSKPLSRIEAKRVSAALSAESTGTSVRLSRGPLSMFQVRQELSRRLQSSGGRPGLADASLRVKIPLNEDQWNELEQIAHDVASPGFSPSAGQIASVLITLSLQSMRKE